MKVRNLTTGDRVLLDEETQYLYGERYGKVKKVFSAGGTYAESMLIGLEFENIPCTLFYQLGSEVVTSQ